MSFEEGIVTRAVRLADTGHYSGWFYIRQDILEANQLLQGNNPLDDPFVRLDLDARCLAANRRLLLQA